MTPKQLSDEYLFLREKLEKIASLIAGDCKVEAAFMLGCLHSVCHNHHIEWKNINDQLTPPIQEGTTDGA